MMKSLGHYNNSLPSSCVQELAFHIFCEPSGLQTLAQSSATYRSSVSRENNVGCVRMAEPFNKILAARLLSQFSSEVG